RTLRHLGRVGDVIHGPSFLPCIGRQLPQMAWIDPALFLYTDMRIHKRYFDIWPIGLGTNAGDLRWHIQALALFRRQAELVPHGLSLMAGHKRPSRPIGRAGA